MVKALFEPSAAGDEEEDRRGLPTVPFARLAQSLQPPEGRCPSGGGQGSRGSHGHGVRPGCLLQAPRLHHPSLPREGAAPRETHLSLSVLPRPAGGRQAALQSAALGLHEEMLPGRSVLKFSSLFLSVCFTNETDSFHVCATVR